MGDESKSKVYPIFTTRNLKRTPTGSNVEKSDKSKFTDELCAFTGETTLHGIRYVGNRSICFARRCIWTILVASALCVLGFILRKSVVHYQERPFGTKISILRNSEIPFPAVTFCNYNQLRKSKMTEEQKALNEAINIGIPLNFTGTENWNITEIFLNGSHPIEDLLVDCLWMSVDQCGPENFTTELYDFGVCYTFKTNLNVSNAGVTSALSLIININDTENTGHRYGITGIKMMIHPPTERPLVASYGFGVAPGFHAEVALRGTQVRNLPSPYSSKCRKEHLRYSNVYTKELCIEECRSDYVIDRCGCKLSVMMGNVPACNVKQALECGFIAYDRFVSDKNVTCDCPVACVKTTYEPKISTTLWPDAVMLRYFEEHYGYSKEYVRENMLQVRISFEDLDMEVTELVSSYTVVQLLSEIGGNMGLLCGMSIGTLVEFVDFAIVALLERLVMK